jgi:hypothetical protein
MRCKLMAKRADSNSASERLGRRDGIIVYVRGAG